VDIADKALAESVAIRAVAPEIAVIANIPQNRHEAFGAELQDIINIAHGRLLNRAFVHGLSPKEQKTFEDGGECLKAGVW
jgi:hypothetical protein